MVAGIVLIAVGLALLALAWRAWSGAWRAWAAVGGFPVYNSPITVLPGFGVLLLCAGIGVLGGGPAVTAIGIVVLLVTVGLNVADPQWWGPRWYRTGDWPAPPDGFGRELGRYKAEYQGQDGELKLEATRIVFIPAAGASGLGIPWGDVHGARAEDGTTLCIEAQAESRFTLRRAEKVAQRIANIAGARTREAPAAAAVPGGRIEPL
jgi:hypothetical protein